MNLSASLTLLLLEASACLFLLVPCDSFVVHSKHHQPRRIVRLFSEIELATLRVSEIKTELKERGVDYADCFDKESLLVKLKSARETGGSRVAVVDDVATDASASSNDSSSSPTPSTQAPSPRISDADLLQELGQKSVKELRQELATRNLRWAGLLEKKELVQAVFEALQADAVFSATGLMTPGQVCNMSQDDLQREIQASDKVPLLVDVYATWCGPCQLMAKELEQAAAELGNGVRVAKLDSDQNEKLASQLKVQGLPTLILFENGQEVKRMEGAVMKHQLMEWVVEE